MTVPNDQVAPRPEPQVPLALSILDWRHWCGDCRHHADQIRLALLGARVEDFTPPPWDEAA